MRTAFARTAISCLNIVLRQARDLGAVLPLSEDEACVPSGAPERRPFFDAVDRLLNGHLPRQRRPLRAIAGCGAFAERLQTKKTTTISDRGQSVKHLRRSALQ